MQYVITCAAFDCDIVTNCKKCILAVRAADNGIAGMNSFENIGSAVAECNVDFQIRLRESDRAFNFVTVSVRESQNDIAVRIAVSMSNRAVNNSQGIVGSDIGNGIRAVAYCVFENVSVGTAMQDDRIVTESGVNQIVGGVAVKRNNVISAAAVKGDIGMTDSKIIIAVAAVNVRAVRAIVKSDTVASAAAVNGRIAVAGNYRIIIAISEIDNIIHTVGIEPNLISAVAGINSNIFS